MSEVVTLLNPDGATVEFGTAADVERREVLRVTRAIIWMARQIREDDRDLSPRITYTGNDPWPWTALICVRGDNRRIHAARNSVTTRRSMGATGRTPHHALAALLEAVRLDHQRAQLRAIATRRGIVYTTEAMT